MCEDLNLYALKARIEEKEEELFIEENFSSFFFLQHQTFSRLEKIQWTRVFARTLERMGFENALDSTATRVDTAI